MVTLRVLYRATQDKECPGSPTDMNAFYKKMYKDGKVDTTWPSNNVFKSGKCTTFVKCVEDKKTIAMSVLVTATDCPGAAPSTSGASRVWLSLAATSTAGMAFLL